jgi:hypothetical protein
VTRRANSKLVEEFAAKKIDSAGWAIELEVAERIEQTRFFGSLIPGPPI